MSLNYPQNGAFHVFKHFLIVILRVVGEKKQSIMFKLIDLYEGDKKILGQKFFIQIFILHRCFPKIINFILWSVGPKVRHKEDVFKELSSSLWLRSEQSVFPESFCAMWRQSQEEYICRLESLGNPR